MCCGPMARAVCVSWAEVTLLVDLRSLEAAGACWRSSVDVGSEGLEIDLRFVRTVFTGQTLIFEMKVSGLLVTHHGVVSDSKDVYSPSRCIMLVCMYMTQHRTILQFSTTLPKRCVCVIMRPSSRPKPRESAEGTTALLRGVLSDSSDPDHSWLCRSEIEQLAAFWSRL